MSRPVIAYNANCTTDLDNYTFQMLVVELGLQETLQLFSEFFEEAESRFIHLRKLSYENGQAIEREAHGLKGAAGNFGLACLSELAAFLERDARTLTAESYDAAICRLESSYATARQEFLSLAG